MLDAMMDFADPGGAPRSSAELRGAPRSSFGAPRSSFLELFSGAPLVELCGAPPSSASGALKWSSTELCSFGAPRSSFLELFSGAPLAEFRGALFWSSFLELRGAPLAELRGGPRSSAELRGHGAKYLNPRRRQCHEPSCLPNAPASGAGAGNAVSGGVRTVSLVHQSSL
eukprot:gene15469-biopygen1572